jgi:hypothetical protein
MTQLRTKLRERFQRKKDGDLKLPWRLLPAPAPAAADDADGDDDDDDDQRLKIPSACLVLCRFDLETETRYAHAHPVAASSLSQILDLSGFRLMMNEDHKLQNGVGASVCVCVCVCSACLWLERLPLICCVCAHEIGFAE